MGEKLRIATFNVENLFSRARILNLRDSDTIDDRMAQVGELSKLIRQKANFSTAQKARILELLKDLRLYVEVRQNRGKLVNSKKTKVLAKSGKDWDGELAFKRSDFSDLARDNTAKVIKKTKADIACIVEADSRPTLKAFDSDLLNYRFKYEMLVDGNDRRGIDVGLYSRYPLGGIWTHIFDKVGNSYTFSRDCPEYELFPPDGEPIYVLPNHLKSKGYDFNGTASQRRKRQAAAVAEILNDYYDLRTDRVVVAGDLNDTPDSAPLKPLMELPHLHDVLELQFGGDMRRRWTYHYRGKFDQIDYVLVSEPLKDAFKKAGVERRGMYNLKKLTEGSNGKVPVETQWESVQHWTDGASDHGAVWAEFEL